MKKLIVIVLCLVINSVSAITANDTTPTQDKSHPAGLKEKYRLSLADEYSRVTVGERKGYWNVFNSTLSYQHNYGILQSTYLSLNELKRFGDTDNTIDAGAYFKSPDAYGRIELGIGAKVDYVYQSQATLEYAHRISGPCFVQLGARHRNHETGDVKIYSPGLAYYFGNHYINADYNTSSTQKRGSAHWVALKSAFVINEYATLRLGAVKGERIYDINFLDAPEQKGYIAYANAEFKISNNVGFSLGASHSEEKPSFTKRSLDSGISIKF